MKKILIPALALTLGLTACQKPAEDTKNETTNETPTQATTEPTPPTTDATPTHDPEIAEGEEQHDHADDDHSHDGHNHAHDGHNHDHDNGDAYQCGDKTTYIAVHDHEGETEVLLTADDITYDLSQDVQTKGRFTTNDSIVGDDKGMALVMNGNQVKITTLDDKLLLDCIKK